jgi:acyl carrier protein
MRDKGKVLHPYDLVANALGCEKNTLSEESGLNSHAEWDSLGYLKILLAMEKEYNIDINDKTIDQFMTMRAIIAFYKRISQ